MNLTLPHMKPQPPTKWKKSEHAPPKSVSIDSSRSNVKTRILIPQTNGDSLQTVNNFKKVCSDSTIILTRF